MNEHRERPTMSTAAVTPSAIPATDTERRVAPRRQPAMGTVCRLDTEDAGPTPLALVWNISATGISVLVSEPREPGTLLTGFLERLECDQTLRVAMRVIHTKRLETGDYFLGAHFERALTVEELKSFVAEG
jgi:hypothetical protein